MMNNLFDQQPLEEEPDVRAIEVKEMYEAKMPILDIMNETGLTKAEVLEMLSEQGMIDVSDFGSPRMTRILDSFNDDQIEEFKRDYYESWLPMRDIREKWGFSSNTVIYSMLNQLHLVPRSTSRDYIKAREAQMDHAIDLYQKGWILADIVIETGVDQPTLSKELRRRKIPGRRAKRMHSRLDANKTS
jgi:hypothetical protein